MSLPRQLFITGTGTDIGKTVVSGVLVTGQSADYWKPIQTGYRLGTDSEWIRQHTGVADAKIHQEAYSFSEPLSPHEAAALENATIDLDQIVLPTVTQDTPLIVEGAGGVLVPLNRDTLMLDLILQLKLPVLVVADSQLGTINHTLLTVNQLKQSGVAVAGVVMNGPKNPANRDAIETYGGVRVIAEIEPLEQINPDTLAACFRENFS